MAHPASKPKWLATAALITEPTSVMLPQQSRSCCSSPDRKVARRRAAPARARPGRSCVCPPVLCQKNSIPGDFHLEAAEAAGVDPGSRLLFAQTDVVEGSGKGVVVRTGMDTEMGKIQRGVTEAASDEQARRTPLAIKLDEFGDTLTRVIGIICVAVWAASIPKFYDPTFKTPVEGAIYYAKVVSGNPSSCGLYCTPQGCLTICIVSVSGRGSWRGSYSRGTAGCYNPMS